MEEPDEDLFLREQDLNSYINIDADPMKKTLVLRHHAVSAPPKMIYRRQNVVRLHEDDEIIPEADEIKIPVQKAPVYQFTLTETQK